MSKCPPTLSRAEAEDMIARIRPKPYQRVFFSAIQYDAPYDFFTGGHVSLQGKNLLLVSGIAKPAPLMDFLEQQAAELHTLNYPDHHYFLSRDLEEIKSTYEGWQATNKAIVTTEKDAARLQLLQSTLEGWEHPIIVLPVRVEILFNEGAAFDNTVVTYVMQTLAMDEATRPLIGGTG